METLPNCFLAKPDLDQLELYRKFLLDELASLTAQIVWCGLTERKRCGERKRPCESEVSESTILKKVKYWLEALPKKVVLSLDPKEASLYFSLLENVLEKRQAAAHVKKEAVMDSKQDEHNPYALSSGYRLNITIVSVKELAVDILKAMMNIGAHVVTVQNFVTTNGIYVCSLTASDLNLKEVTDLQIEHCIEDCVTKWKTNDKARIPDLPVALKCLVDTSEFAASSHREEDSMPRDVLPSPGNDLESEAPTALFGLPSDTWESSEMHGTGSISSVSPRDQHPDFTSEANFRECKISAFDIEQRPSWQTSSVSPYCPCLSNNSRRDSFFIDTSNEEVDDSDCSTKWVLYNPIGENEGQTMIHHLLRGYKFNIDQVELCVIGVLRKGDTSSVYCAHYRGKLVALKVLNTPVVGLTEDDKGLTDILKTTVKCFKHEVDVLKGLCHPHIYRFIGSCIYDAQPSLVLEYFTDNLSDFIRKGGSSHTVPLVKLLELMAQVANAVRYIHLKGYIHRDLKSPNLLLNKEKWICKVADMGVSYYVGEGDAPSGETGSYRWMAPEVIRHEKYGRPVDVYSYGITLWEVVARKLPFRHMTPLQAALSVAKHRMRPRLPDRTPSRLRELIAKCWCNNPKSRLTFESVCRKLPEVMEDYSVQLYSPVLKTCLKHDKEA